MTFVNGGLTSNTLLLGSTQVVSRPVQPVSDGAGAAAGGTEANSRAARQSSRMRTVTPKAVDAFKEAEKKGVAKKPAAAADANAEAKAAAPWALRRDAQLAGLFDVPEERRLGL